MILSVLSSARPGLPSAAKGPYAAATGDAAAFAALVGVGTTGLAQPVGAGPDTAVAALGGGQDDAVAGTPLPPTPVNTDDDANWLTTLLASVAPIGATAASAEPAAAMPPVSGRGEAVPIGVATKAAGIVPKPIASPAASLPPVAEVATPDLTTTGSMLVDPPLLDPAPQESYPPADLPVGPPTQRQSAPVANASPAIATVKTALRATATPFAPTPPAIMSPAPMLVPTEREHPSSPDDTDTAAQADPFAPVVQPQPDLAAMVAAASQSPIPQVGTAPVPAPIAATARSISSGSTAPAPITSPVIVVDAATPPPSIAPASVRAFVSVSEAAAAEITSPARSGAVNAAPRPRPGMASVAFPTPTAPRVIDAPTPTGRERAPASLTRMPTMLPIAPSVPPVPISVAAATVASGDALPTPADTNPAPLVAAATPSATPPPPLAVAPGMSRAAEPPILTDRPVPNSPSPAREIAPAPVAVPPPSAFPTTATAASPAGTIAPAGEMFAAAIHAAGREQLRDGDIPASSATPLAAAAPIAVSANAAAGGNADPSLDMRHGNWPGAMIDHIEKLRDAADAVDTRIRVVPDALGGIDVSLRRHDDGVQVSLRADQPATQAMLAEARPQLAALAEARGIRLADGGGAGAGGMAGGDPSTNGRQQPSAFMPIAPVSATSTPDDSDPAGGRVA